MRTRVLAIFLTSIMLFTLCPVFVTDASAEVAKELPNAADITIDLNDYYGQKIEGFYNFDCVVSSTVTRTAKFYIPPNTVFNQPTVFVGVPGGEDTWNFLVESGWKDLADEKGLHIVLMEPENGEWGTDEEEIAYISALNQDVSYRPFFCAFSSNFYGIGYGEAADLLQKQSVNNPKSWAAIALMGASGMTAAEVAALQETPSLVPGVSLAEAQTPVWIVAAEKDADVSLLIDFYKSANHSQTTQEAVSYADELYLPMEGGSVDDWWCANVVFDAADWMDCINKDYSESIYTQLFEGTYRYPGNANGALRRPGEIFARGFKYFEAQVPGGYYEDGSDVYNREWYVYVPESAQAKIDNGENVPMLFAFHGAGGSGNEIADRSGWATVAKEKGFILVCPTASHRLSIRNVSNITTNEYFRAIWYTSEATEESPSDLKFIEYVYDWMLAHYNIDASRVYASGQSSGGAMSWACAGQLPDLFTAVAPVSMGGTLFIDNIPIGTSLVPVDCYLGELDQDFTIDRSRTSLENFISLYNTVEQYSDYTFKVKGEDRIGTDYTSRTGEEYYGEGNNYFTNYLFNTAYDVPLIRAVEVETKTHAIWPSESFDAWSTWFINYSKDPMTHLLYYQGDVVGTTLGTIETLSALLDAYYEGGDITNEGIYNSLKVKLEKGNLKAFMNELDAKTSKKHISNEASGYLMAFAQRLFIEG